MTPALFDPDKQDVARLAALHHSAFPDPWNAAALIALMAGPGVFAFSTTDGFVLARVAGGEAEILTLAVAPGARGQGLGRALVIAATSHAGLLGAGTVFLEVATDNKPALALYSRLGFAPVGQRKAYYDGKDALVLRLALSPGNKFA